MSVGEPGATPTPAPPGGASAALAPGRVFDTDGPGQDEGWTAWQENELLASQHDRLAGEGEREDDDRAWTESDERALLDAGEPELAETRAQFDRGEIALDRYLQRLVHAHNAPGDAPETLVETPGRASDEPPVSMAVSAMQDQPAGVLASEDPLAHAEDTSLPDANEPAAASPAGATAAPTRTRRASSDRPVVGGRFQLEEWLGRDETSDIYRSRDLLAAMYDGPPIVRLRLLRRAVTEDRGRLSRALRALARTHELPPRARSGELHRFEDDYVIVSDWPEVPAPKDAVRATTLPAEEHTRRLHARIAVLALSALVTWVVTREPPAGLPSREPAVPATAPMAPLAAPPIERATPIGLAPGPTPLAPGPLQASNTVPAISAVAMPGPASIAPAKARTRVAARPLVGFASGRVIAREGTRFVLLRVKATGSLREPVRLSVNATGGAATVNQDFVPPAAGLTLTRQRPSADVLVSLLADDSPEYTEDFTVALRVGSGDARLGTASSVVVITDDD